MERWISPGDKPRLNPVKSQLGPVAICRLSRPLLLIHGLDPPFLLDLLDTILDLVRCGLSRCIRVLCDTPLYYFLYTPLGTVRCPKPRLSRRYPSSTCSAQPSLSELSLPSGPQPHKQTSPQSTTPSAPPHSHPLFPRDIFGGFVAVLLPP